MQRIDVETLKSQHSVLSILDARNIQLHGCKELCGPCPKCGGTDRFHAKDEWFFCRQCHEKMGDVIELIQWLDGIDFRTACETLGVSANHQRFAPAAKPSVKEKAPDFRVAAMRLSQRSDAECEEYLYSRGLKERTWRKYGVGFDSRFVPGKDYKAAAIALPWIMRNGSVRGIRYRFTRSHDGCKQTAMKGSKFGGGVYGGHVLDWCDGEIVAQNLRTLIIVEGEINAMSIWQETSGVDVLSVGSESTRLGQGVISLLSGYRYIITWMDKWKVAERFARDFDGALPFASEQDANDMLQGGSLSYCVSRLMRKAITDDETIDDETRNRRIELYCS